jgi:hypothetical protein
MVVWPTKLGTKIWALTLNGSFFPGPDFVNISMAYSEVIDDQQPRGVL